MPDEYSHGPGALSRLERALPANATQTAFGVTLGQSETLPEGFQAINGHIGLYPLMAIGEGVSGATFNFRVLLAHELRNGNRSEFYISQLAEVAAVLGDTAGEADRLVTDTERFAWSLTVTDGLLVTAYPSSKLVVANGASAAGETAIGRIEDLGQPSAIGFDFDLDAGAGTAATGANVLFGLVS